MNALVGIRSNATGLFSPTSEQRQVVAERLAALGGRKSAAGRVSGPRQRPVQGLGASKAAGESSGNATGRSVNTELSREMFLELLVMQMQNQDPLEPVSNQDMLAQLAQFSALEQMENLNRSFESLSGNIDQLNFISATGLLGRNVSGIGTTGQLFEGLVESVQLDGSVVVLTVDGQAMSMAGVLRIDAAGNGEADDG